MPLPKPDQNYSQFSFLSLARMCWMHRLGIVAIWIVFTAATVAVVSRLPAIYTAEALIVIDAQKIPERLVPSTVSSDTEDRLANISQRILSNTRLKKIIADNDLYLRERRKRPLDDVVQDMRSDISVKIVRGGVNNKPDAFRVGYSGTHPATVAQVTNQIANLFIEENLLSREGQAEGTSEFLATQVDEAKKKLDTLETAIREYKARHDGELPEQQGALQSAMNRLQMEQASNRDAIDRAEQSKATLQDTLRMAQDTLAVLLKPQPSEAAPPAAASSPAGGPNVNLLPSAPKKQSQIIEEQLAVLLDRYGPEYPDVKRLTADLAKAKAAEALQPHATVAAAVPARKPAADAPAHAKAATPNALDVGQARERIQVLKSQIALAQKEIDSRTADQQRISAQTTDLQAKLTAVPLREQELAQVMRDYDITKLNYHSLLEKQLSAEMSTDMERRQKAERFTIIDPAHVPDRPSKPNRPFFDAVGSAFFLCVTVTLFIGMELRKDNLLGEWELPQHVPVLARVPRISMPDGGGFRPWTRSAAARAIVISLVVAAAAALAAARIWLAHGF